MLLTSFGMTMAPFQLPRITSDTALFLDFDGTLAGLAPQPDQVHVPPGLVGTLAALSARLGGALALVSGRPLRDLDHFLAPLQLPAAVEHGAQRRAADGRLVSAPSVDLTLVHQAAAHLAQQHPGLLLEEKNLAISLHYRHAPELEGLCLQAMREAVARSPGLDLMQGKFVLDIKPAGSSKGTAIADFMAETPFAGRTPVFVGDDVTDEAGFAQVQRLGGHAIKVGPGPTLATYRCASVEAVARWLQAAGSARLDDDGVERISA